MTRLFQKLMLVGLLGALTVPAVAYAQNRPMGPGGDRPNKTQLWDRLNLSSEQRQQITSIREQDKDQNTRLRDQIKAAQTQLRQLWAGNASDAQITQQRNQLNALKQQAQELRFQQSLKLRAVLTPDQRQQLEQLRSERRQQWRDRTKTQTQS